MLEFLFATENLPFVVALGAGFGFTGPITIFFVSLWLISAGLFRRAAGDRDIALDRPTT